MHATKLIQRSIILTCLASRALKSDEEMRCNFKWQRQVEDEKTYIRRPRDLDHQFTVVQL